MFSRGVKKRLRGGQILYASRRLEHIVSRASNKRKGTPVSTQFAIRN
jgi:hypothetical protein